MDRATQGHTQSITDLARAIRARRRALSLTQENVADLAGVSTRFVHDLERGKATVQLGKYLAVLDALGLRLQMTVGDQGTA